MSRIILVRHGETEANRRQCFAASDDIPLSEAGRAQSRELARRIAARFHPAIVFTSAFARARETGELIARALSVGVEVLPGIHERDFGCLKGCAHECMGQLMDSDPEYDPERAWAWKPDGGESLEEVRLRALAALEEMHRRNPGKEVVVVSHGAVIQAVSAFTPGNCEGIVTECPGENFSFLNVEPLRHVNPER